MLVYQSVDTQKSKNTKVVSKNHEIETHNLAHPMHWKSVNLTYWMYDKNKKSKGIYAAKSTHTKISLESYR